MVDRRSGDNGNAARGRPDAVTQRVERVSDRYLERPDVEPTPRQTGLGPTGLSQAGPNPTVNVNAPGSATSGHDPWVVRDARPRPAYVARYPTVSPSERIVQIMWFMLALLEGFLAIRVFLKLIAANPANQFASFVDAVTRLFVAPFVGLVPTPRLGPSVLEIDTLMAMIVYVFVWFALVRLVEILSNRPDL